MDSGFKKRGRSSSSAAGSSAWQRPGGSVLSRRCDGVTLLQKDAKVASQQSTHDSGVPPQRTVLQAGVREGFCSSVRELPQWSTSAGEHGIRHEICGEDRRRHEHRGGGKARLSLGAWHPQRSRRPAAWLDSPEAIREIEPHAAGIAAIHVPQEGSPSITAESPMPSNAEIVRLGGRVVGQRPGDTDRAERQSPGDWRARQATSAAELVINCGGLHADRIVAPVRA
jgi:L-2-hydroxyglutarate oxidase